MVGTAKPPSRWRGSLRARKEADKRWRSTLPAGQQDSTGQRRYSKSLTSWDRYICHDRAR